MLIYLQPVLQKKALSVFQFALKQHGYLFLGPSETLAENTTDFETINKRWKIHRNLSANNTFMPDGMLVPQSSYLRKPTLQESKIDQLGFKGAHTNLVDTFKKLLIDEYCPMAAFVNDKYEVLFLTGGINKYLKLPEEKISLNILKMLPEGLTIPLNTAIRKAVKTSEEVQYDNIKFKVDAQHTTNFSVRVKYLEDVKESTKIFLITFEEVKGIPTTQEIKEFDVEVAIKDRMDFLENQLKDTRDNLEDAIEELETSNEELQVSNEELMAANEELQSTNEELQSVNEELHTVNSELQAKIMDLTELTNDMDNLLISSEIGTIFLDTSMRIRKFTPAIQSQFKLMDQDIGRPIIHFKASLGGQDIIGLSQKVLDTGKTIEKSISNGERGNHLMRLSPYKTKLRAIEGVVITFIDISNI